MSRLRSSKVFTTLRYVRFTHRYQRRAVLALGGLVGLGFIWIAVTAYLAKQQGNDIVQRIQVARVLVAEGRTDEARKVAADIPAMTARAHRLTTGPAWWLAAQVPYLGRPVAEARQVAAVQDDVGGRSVPALLRAAGILNPDALRASGSTFRLAPLAKARPDLVSAAASLRSATADLQGSPSSWLDAVNSGRDSLAAQLTTLSGYVDAAERATTVLPAMLGGSGRQTYFIGLQNEAESRGTGGLPGAFTIATAVNGTVTFTKFENDAVLLPGKDQLIPTGLDFGNQYNNLYAGSNPTASYQDSNVSPNFPYAAQIWASMWRKVSGQQVDGVIAVDPTTLSYFLGAVGPAQIPGGATITASNVVPLTERDEYAIFNDNATRRKFLVAVVKASAAQLISGKGSATALVQAASRAATEQRLLIWSRDPSVERLLAQTAYAGAIPRTNRPFSAMIVNNAAAGKLDYYLKRTFTYTSTGCGAYRDVYVQMTLTNDAPASGLSPYVTGRLDKNPPHDAKPGDNRVLLDYFGTTGGQLRSVTLDGKTTTASVNEELGHPVYRLDLEVPRGATRTVVLRLNETSGRGQPIVWNQPGVNPLAMTISNQEC